MTKHYQILPCSQGSHPTGQDREESLSPLTDFCTVTAGDLTGPEFSLSCQVPGQCLSCKITYLPDRFGRKKKKKKYVGEIWLKRKSLTCKPDIIFFASSISFSKWSCCSKSCSSHEFSKCDTGFPACQSGWKWDSVSSGRETNWMWSWQTVIQKRLAQHSNCLLSTMSITAKLACLLAAIYASFFTQRKLSWAHINQRWLASSLFINLLDLMSFDED